MRFLFYESTLRRTASPGVSDPWRFQGTLPELGEAPAKEDRGNPQQKVGGTRPPNDGGWNPARGHRNEGEPPKQRGGGVEVGLCSTWGSRGRGGRGPPLRPRRSRPRSTTGRSTASTGRGARGGAITARRPARATSKGGTPGPHRGTSPFASNACKPPPATQEENSAYRLWCEGDPGAMKESVRMTPPPMASRTRG